MRFKGDRFTTQPFDILGNRLGIAPNDRLIATVVNLGLNLATVLVTIKNHKEAISPAGDWLRPVWLGEIGEWRSVGEIVWGKLTSHWSGQLSVTGAVAKSLVAAQFSRWATATASTNERKAENNH